MTQLHRPVMKVQICCGQRHSNVKHGMQREEIDYLFSLFLLFLLWVYVHLSVRPGLIHCTVVVIVIVVVVVCSVQTVGHIAKQLKAGTHAEQELTGRLPEAKPVLVACKHIFVRKKFEEKQLAPPLVPNEVMTSVKNVSRSGEVAAKKDMLTWGTNVRDNTQFSYCLVQLICK